MPKPTGRVQRGPDHPGRGSGRPSSAPCRASPVGARGGHPRRRSGPGLRRPVVLCAPLTLGPSVLTKKGRSVARGHGPLGRAPPTATVNAVAPPCAGTCGHGRCGLGSAPLSRPPSDARRVPASPPSSAPRPAPRRGPSRESARRSGAPGPGEPSIHECSDCHAGRGRHVRARRRPRESRLGREALGGARQAVSPCSASQVA